MKNKGAITMVFALLLGGLTGCGGSGTSNNNNGSSSSLPAGTELLYVGDNAGVIHGFGISPDSGKLTPLPSGATTKLATAADVGLASDSGSMALYATSAGLGSANVESLLVSQTTGALTAKSSQTLPVPPRKLTAVGNNLYVVPDPNANTAGIFAFSISASGTLSLLPNQPIALPGVPHDLAADPSSSWLFVSFEGSSTGRLAIFPLKNSAIGGAAQFVNTGGDSPQGVRVTPDGKFVVVVNQGTSNVSVFSLDSSTGTLSAVPGSPFAGGNQPAPVAIDPGGNYVFIGDTGGNSLSALTISAAGDLAPLAGTPIQLGDAAQPSSIAVDPAGKFVYIAISPEEIAGFSINQSTGALSPVSGSPFFVGQSTRDLVIMPNPAQ